MSENSKIEWTDHTFNPWIGCTKVSPGCAHCYAETQNNLRKWNPAGWGKGVPRRRTSEANWKQPLKWNRDATGSGTRPRVFCASLADWLDDEVPIEWLSDLLYLVIKCQNLDWLLLTKRPQLWRSRLQDVANHSDIGAMIAQHWLDGNPPPNVWIGTTVENQEMADERIPHLLTIPARVRFLSCEPLLGPVILRDHSVEFGDGSAADLTDAPDGWDFPSDIHWVICGGESGPGARPMHPDWARSLRDQCQQAGVPFLFKQWGEWAPDLTNPIPTKNPGSYCYEIKRVGKKSAGRLLDWREWNEFPKGGNQ